MISKDILFLSERLTEFKVSHLTIPVFAIFFYFTLKDMQIYYLDFESNEDHVEESN